MKKTIHRLYKLGLALASILSILSACNRAPMDVPDEDYARLFPFGGIDRPTGGDELVVQLCNPQTELDQYRYDGERKKGESSREYDVTVSVRFREVDMRGQLIPDQYVGSRYRVRYISEDGDYVVLGSDADDETLTEMLTNDKEYTKTFRVHSGYPLYLNAMGASPRGSFIRASISAVSVDRLITVPTISTEQYQNAEDIVQMRYPFCEYVILP